MSVSRVLLAAAACALIAGCDAGPTGTDPIDDAGVIVSTPTPTPPAPGPANPDAPPTLSLGMGDLVPNANGLFSSEIMVTVMNWPNPVVGEKVTFTIVKGSGTLSAHEVLTDDKGEARTTIWFGLADEQVIHARTATSDLAETRVLAYCAAAPEQRTLPCPVP